MKKLIKRRQILVNRPIQLSFIKSGLLTLFIVTIILVAVISIWQSYQYKQGYYFRFTADEEVELWAKENNISRNDVRYWQKYMESAESHTLFELLIIPVVIFSILFIIQAIAISIVFLYLSHRIAGPLVRISNDLQRVENGEKIPPIKLRKNDFLKDLAELINRVLKI